MSMDKYEIRQGTLAAIRDCQVIPKGAWFLVNVSNLQLCPEMYWISQD